MQNSRNLAADRFARLYKSLRRAQPDRIVRAPDGDDKDVFVLCQCTHRNNVGGIARDLIYPLGEGGHIAQVTDCRSDAVSALRRFIRYHLAALPPAPKTTILPIASSSIPGRDVPQTVNGYVSAGRRSRNDEL